MTATPPLFLFHPELEILLVEAADAQQLTLTLQQKVTDTYRAVTDFLGADGSPLAILRPQMYPQGSMALGTTNRPWRRLEHDLDFVLQVMKCSLSAAELYAAVANRLASHAVYRGMLSQKNRCLSLGYAGNFHLDIIPAMVDPMRPDTGILIPDRKLQDWTPSNPKAFLKWFKSRSVVLVQKGHRFDASVEPLPALKTVDEKAPLVIAVQLLKRARDVLFQGHDDSPRSILLTTVAAHGYRGGPSIAAALADAILALKALAANPDAEVCNPTDPSEKFCDCLTPARRQKIANFAQHLENSLVRLSRAEGLDEIKKELAFLFGEEPAQAAMKRFAELNREQREAGRITAVTTATGLVAQPSTQRVKPSHFYGG